MSKPSGTTAPWAGNKLLSSVFNLFADDIIDDLNAARPIVAGGTGATSASAARTALGVQALDATLTALASILTGSGKWPYATGVDTVSEADSTSFGRSLTNASDASALRTLAGVGTISVMDAATAAHFRANTADKALVTDDVWSAAAEVTLTDATTIAVDMSTFINAVVTLGGSRTLGQPSNAKVGQSGCIRIVQDGVGSRTLAYHADWKFAGGIDPTLTTTAGATDLLFYHVVASGVIFAQLVAAIA